MRLGLLATASLVTSAVGCSDFLLNSSVPGDAISARTMDFETDLRSVLEVIPRATHFYEPPIHGCDACPQYDWRSKYGFVSFNTLGINIAVDGLNERGLSAAWLWLDDTEYPVPKTTPPTPQQQHPQPSLPIVASICAYLLGNFATVQEVKRGLAAIQLVGLGNVSELVGMQMPEMLQHVSVHDAAGNSLVIESLHGETKIYDNLNQVMTNEPPLEQQLAMLAASTANVSNMPGDYDSNTRFLRLSLLNRWSRDWTRGNSTAGMSFVAGSDEQRSVANALHLIETVVIPVQSYTQWSVVRDHRRGKLYVQSTQNQLLRRVDLHQIDFGKPSSRRAIPVAFGEWYADVTGAIKDPRNTNKTRDVPAKKMSAKL